MGIRDRRADLYLRVERGAGGRREVHGAPPDQADRRAAEFRDVRPAPYQVRAGGSARPPARQRTADGADDHAARGGEIDGTQSLRIRTRANQDRGLVEWEWPTPSVR